MDGTCHREELHEEFPPVVHNLVHEGIAPGYVLVFLEGLEALLSDIAH